MSDGLTSMLKKLRLSGLGESLEIRLHEASSRGLTHREFLELALQDELLVRDGRHLLRDDSGRARVLSQDDVHRQLRDR